MGGIRFVKWFDRNKDAARFYGNRFEPTSVCAVFHSIKPYDSLVRHIHCTPDGNGLLQYRMLAVVCCANTAPTCYTLSAKDSEVCYKLYGDICTQRVYGGCSGKGAPPLYSTYCCGSLSTPARTPHTLPVCVNAKGGYESNMYINEYVCLCITFMPSCVNVRGA